MQRDGTPEVGLELSLDAEWQSYGTVMATGSASTLTDEDAIRAQVGTGISRVRVR
jgi:hypothetical protein